MTSRFRRVLNQGVFWGLFFGAAGAVLDKRDGSFPHPFQSILVSLTFPALVKGSPSSRVPSGLARFGNLGLPPSQQSVHGRRFESSCVSYEMLPDSLPFTHNATGSPSFQSFLISGQEGYGWNMTQGRCRSQGKNLPVAL